MTTATAPSVDLNQFAALYVSKLKPNPNNPRRIDDKHPSLVGLAESITAHGVLEPILVRDLGDDGYMILAGERRWRAARIAKLEKIPCSIRVCDDQAAFEITVTENLQREDLHWLEESRGVELMLKKGWDAETIARHIGKSASWVHLRAKLSTISPKWKDAVEDAESGYSHWPASMLEIIARMPLPVQDEILKKERFDLRECTSAADLRHYLDKEYLRLLTAASWDVADAKLVPKAGACNACPKRSSCQQNLFDDAKDDKCLDAACWVSKEKAAAVVKLKELKAKHPDVQLVSTDYWMDDKSKTLGSKDYTIVKATAKGAKQALLVDGDSGPRMVYIATGPNRYSGSRDSSSGSKGDGKKTETPPKVRLAEFMKRRKRAQVKRVITMLGGDPDESPYQVRYRTKWKPVAEGMTLPDLQTMTAIAVTLGIDISGRGEWKDAARMQGLSQLLMLRETWDAIRPSIIRKLAWDAVECESGGAEFVAKICEITWTGIVTQVRDSMPLPKTLAAHFDENGMPAGKALAPKKAKAKK